MLQDLSAIRLIYGDSFADSLESFLYDLSQLHAIFSYEIDIPSEDWYSFDLMSKIMEPNPDLPYLLQQEMLNSFGRHFYGAGASFRSLTNYDSLT